MSTVSVIIPCHREGGSSVKPWTQPSTRRIPEQMSSWWQTE